MSEVPRLDFNPPRTAKNRQEGKCYGAIFPTLGPLLLISPCEAVGTPKNKLVIRPICHNLGPQEGSREVSTPPPPVLRTSDRDEANGYLPIPPTLGPLRLLSLC